MELSEWDENPPTKKEMVEEMLGEKLTDEEYLAYEADQDNEWELRHTI